MKKYAVAILFAFILCVAWMSVSAAAEVQVVDTLMGKILERYTVPTNFGNIYFNQRDVHRIVHAAARLSPLDLGSFTTDAGKIVRVKAKKFDRGMVTLVVTH